MLFRCRQVEDVAAEELVRRRAEHRRARFARFDDRSPVVDEDAVERGLTEDAELLRFVADGVVGRLKQL